MSEHHIYLDMSGQPIPTLMDRETGQWTWWDFEVGREVACDPEAVVVWTLWIRAMEAMRETAPGLWDYVDRLKPSRVETTQPGCPNVATVRYRTLSPKPWGTGENSAL